MTILKSKGHPSYRLMLNELVSATAEGDDIAVVELSPKRSRDLHLIVAGLPVFSRNTGRPAISRLRRWSRR